MPETAETPYPHIRVGGLLLPDCARGIYRPFRIGGREKRALVRALAEKGISGLDGYIAQGRIEGEIGERLDEIRKRISEQVERVKSSRREALEAELSMLGKDGRFSMAESSDGTLADGSAFRRYASEEIRGALLADDLIGMLESEEAKDRSEIGRGFLRMIWDAIRRFASRVWDAFLRFIYWITSPFRSSRAREERMRKREKGAILLPFPAIGRDLERWKGDLERRLPTDRRLQKTVDQRISDRYGYSSGMIRLRSKADPEWYREEAESLLREEAARKADEAMKAVEGRKREMSSESERRRKEEQALKDSIYRAQKRFEDEAGELDRSTETRSREELRKELLSTLTHMGLLQRGGPEDSDYEITEVLVEKFAELLYTELKGSKWGHRERRGRQISDTGVYDKERLRTVDEESRMDLLTSVTNGRINHPGDRGLYDSDIVVMREVSTSELHAVILVDISGSMEENGRLEAAKRAALALVQAVKRDNPRNLVDIISVSTRARPVTLREVMRMEPHGFTNMQEAFALAQGLMASSRSDRRLVFLVTDGMPEAYTGLDGNPVAGDLAKAMDLALSEAERLGRLEGMSFVMFLLEPKDPAYLKAARRIADAGSGSVITADPQQLATQMLGSYYGSGGVMSGI
jgi:Mg-chelatase subunit ChlD